MREALIVWGGWPGHEPEKGARIIESMLTEEGFKVQIEASTSAFLNRALPSLSLIVPIYTMAQIEKPQAIASPAPSRAASGSAAITAAWRTPSARRPSTSS